MSIRQIQLGQTISTEPIPKFSAKEGNYYVLSILDPTYVFAVKSYFVDAKKEDQNKNILGYIHAHDDLVPILGVPSLHYYTPIIQYSLKGRFIKEGYGEDVDRIEFKFLKLGPANYDKILSTSNSVQDISDLDLSFEVNKGKEKYQDYNIIPITTNSSKWKQIPELVIKANMYKDLFKNILPGIVGEVVSAHQVNEYLRGKKSADILAEIKGGKSIEFIAAPNNQPAAFETTAQVRSLPAPTTHIPIVEVSEDSIDLTNLIQTQPSI